MANEPNVILRDLANQNRQSVGFDKATGNVQVGSAVYTPAQLQSMGGQLTNGRWALPQSAANQIVGSQSNWQSPAQQQQMSQMQSMLQNLSGQYYQGQMAQLSSARDSQLKELQSAYADAISEGKGSIRDANSSYESQKGEIQQQAYLDAEQTALYGNDMGIQNSQQMAGLMAGDNARKNTMLNSNMTERDKRIAEINDRLDSIKTKRDLDIANVNSQYDSGLLQARSQAGQMYSNNLFGLYQDDYAANRNQQNALQQMDYQNKLAIEQMGKQQEFNLQTLAKTFDYDLQKMQVQYGYSSSLQAQQAAASAAAASRSYQQKIAYEESQYQKELQRALAGTKEGTPEYELIKATKAQELKDKLQNAAASTMFDYQLSQITTNASNVPYPTEPKWNDNAFIRALTGYDSKYNKYQEEVNAYNNNPRIVAQKKMLESLGLDDIFN